MIVPDKIQAYLSFTKKERIGIVALVTLILIVFLVPCFIPAPKPVFNQVSFDQFKNEIAQLKTIPKKDSSRFAYRGPPVETRYKHKKQATSGKYADLPKPVLFYFDPNTISENQWKELGVREKTAATIRNYIAKGGRFRTADDLQKIYGLGEEQCRRLMPFVNIESPAATARFTKRPEDAGLGKRKKETHQPVIVDINNSDTSAWIALPGIGSRLAARIIGFRQKLGGFFSVEQVGETFALPDSVFQKIKVYLTVSESALVKMNVNTADANTLRQHPYIRWNLANAIVAYRKQHGPFGSISDLQQVALITPELYQKINPYLQISDQ
jgi:competence protein ComEA